jgi:TetR/AcrR family transcriptional regulator of autoinduction and epiphytic fitness
MVQEIERVVKSVLAAYREAQAMATEREIERDARGELKTQLKSARADVYRARILEVAEPVFAEAGFEGAYIKEIARRAGLSVGTVYGIFESKDAVFLAVHEERTRELFERVAEIVATEESALAILLAGVEHTVRFFCERTDYLRMHLRDRTAWAFSEQSTPPQAASWKQGIEVLSATFAAGMASGELFPGDPESHARLVMAMHQVKLAEWLSKGPGAEVQPVIDELSALVKRAFAR